MQRSRQRVNIKKEKIWRGRGRGKGKRRWWRPGDMPLMPPIHPPANELVIEMWSRQVLITEVSVSLLCRFCKKNVWIQDEVLKSASKEIYFNNLDRQLE